MVRVFDIYPEGPKFKSLSGHFYMFNRTFKFLIRAYII